MLTVTLTTIKAFIAGVLAMLVFHQGALAGLHYLGETPLLAYNMVPAWPFGWPQLATWSLWGGLWGIILWGLIRSAQAAGYYVGAIIMAAVLLTAVYLFVILPLAGRPFAANWEQHFIIGLLIVNAAWGLGLAVFMRVFKPPI